MKIVNICGHSFVKELMGTPAMVLDCGANQGEFSRWIQENFNATVHGFEPDPRLFSKLPKLRNLHFHPIAVSGSGKQLTLRLGNEHCSTAYFTENSNQQTTVVESTKLDEFCSDNSISRVDLIKLDVEGTEIEILINLPYEFIKNVGQITVEFHDFIDRDEVPRIHNVISKMNECGFLSLKFSYFDNADVLFLNMNFHNISSRHIALMYAQKYISGLSRMVRRKLGLNKAE